MAQAAQEASESPAALSSGDDGIAVAALWSGALARNAVGRAILTQPVPALRPLLRHAALLALVLIVGGALIAGYLATQTLVTLELDGQASLVGTHQTTVAAVLDDAGIALQPEDRVEPEPATLIEPGLQIRVQRAHHVTVHVDGRVLETRTHTQAPLSILAELGVRVSPADQVLVDGQLLPGGTAGRDGGQLAAAALIPVVVPPPEPALPDEKLPPGLIEIRRAVEITVDDDGTRLTFQTTQATIGEALHRAGVVLYLGDSVQPPLWTRVSAGLTVQIGRSVPVAIEVDGHSLRTRTFRGSVAEVLADTGVALVGSDYSLPTPESPIASNLLITVVRVREEIVTEQESIAYETVLQGDPTLEIDLERVNQFGELGVRQRRIRVRYENGLEVSRTLEDEWVLKEPVTQIDAYGTQIVIRTLQTGAGPLEYWRVIPMLATSYSASTAGTPRNSPWYGRTRTGMVMRHGLVAIDPSVIPLYTNLYIPGYGPGLAADTGNAIKNRRIDLGYDDDNLVLWYSWVDVYILTPVPDPSRIRYILP